MPTDAGSNCTITFDGATIPATFVGITYHPDEEDERCPRFPDAAVSASVTCSIVWESAIPPDFEEYVECLESRRWSGHLARLFRGREGFRFADILQGVGRN